MQQYLRAAVDGVPVAEAQALLAEVSQGMGYHSRAIDLALVVRARGEHAPPPTTGRELVRRSKPLHVLIRSSATIADWGRCHEASAQALRLHRAALTTEMPA